LIRGSDVETIQKLAAALIELQQPFSLYVEEKIGDVCSYVSYTIGLVEAT